MDRSIIELLLEMALCETLTCLDVPIEHCNTARGMVSTASGVLYSHSQQSINAEYFLALIVNCPSLNSITLRLTGMANRGINVDEVMHSGISLLELVQSRPSMLRLLRIHCLLSDGMTPGRLNDILLHSPKHHLQLGQIDDMLGHISAQTILSFCFSRPIALQRTPFWTREFGKLFGRLQNGCEPVSRVESRSDRESNVTYASILYLISRLTVHCLEGHDEWVSAIAVSPDGRRVATGSYDTTIILWDGAHGRILHEWVAHHGPVSSIVFSPDGQSIVSAGGQDTSHEIVIWETRHQVRRVGAFDGDINHTTRCAWSPDGAIIATASNNNGVYLWDIQSLKLLHQLRGAQYATFDFVQFSPDGRWLLSGDSAWGRCWIWNVSYGTLHKFFDVPIKHCAVFAPCSTRFATALSLGKVHVWDVWGGKELAAARCPVLPGMVRDMAFAPDGRLVVAGDEDVWIWDVDGDSGFHRVKLERLPRHVEGGTYSVYKAFWSRPVSNGLRLVTIAQQNLPQADTKNSREDVVLVGKQLTLSHCLGPPPST